MVRVAWSGWGWVCGVAALGVLPGQMASGAVADAAADQVAAAPPAISEATPISTADVELRYIQEDGPESGHVRVVLTPETRPLTIFEARSAAEQAFLKALDEPGLGDNLRRITVVVRLVPVSHPDPGAGEQVIRFLHKGGRDWSVTSGE